MVVSRQLILKRKSKRRIKKHNYVPIFIIIAVVLSGIVTGGKELKKRIDSNITIPISGSCKNSDLKHANIDLKCRTKIAVNRSEGLSKLPPINKLSADVDQLEQTRDIELENTRLIIQRDIQEIISKNKHMKPFNHRVGDKCVLQVSTKPLLASIRSCTNHVFKRHVELALNTSMVNKVLGENNLNDKTQLIEVRLDFEN